MTFRKLRVAPDATELRAGFERIRRAMHLPQDFPREVVTEANRVASRPPSSEGEVGRSDERDIDLLTIDPPGSRDLDQAFHAEKNGDGYMVHYSIADVAAFVTPGGALDREAWKRGQTLYSPDMRIALYPPELSEGAASLLPDQDTPAILWSIRLDAKGEITQVDVKRALVRSRRQLTYEEAQADIDAGTTPSLGLLRKIGELRIAKERERGGINLEVPEQEVHKTKSGYELAYRTPLPVEQWNAQISLLTGICAAKIMLEAKTGLLRTMPEPEPEVVTQLRLSAKVLGVRWPDDAPYSSVISALDPAHPEQAALLTYATRLFRGTGYAAFDGTLPNLTVHHALASPYAHVTAPLRRLADRYANEVVLALAAGNRPPQWALDGLPKLPEVMKEAHRRDGELERRILDYLESVVLSDKVGHTFQGVVVDEGNKGSTIQLRDPAVIAHCKGACGGLGADVKVKVTEADVERGQVTFQPV